ncbi:MULTISPECIES: 7-cyano-7-deazaguanine synthase [unclassified Roseivivax]|uniref:7-cyano-7-deazaguanine synthase n=1 Tax=unclassified Roseivivax TaxID=2639302 RepID=UPI001268548D|nr:MULTISPECIES: 7-cyano-7-deazaguanine synthase [unclassified Roseivivax]QFT48909.1 7-cyano-7-deazaguanine synthase [Roseivivax sp. THAF40]QFT65129.1 7-cyano-7-deazaguanine synthase [Roseivivax sp. THAF30]
MKALLLSGGMDSIAVAFWQRPEIAITIDYGQRAAEAEIAAASQVAKEIGMQHEIITIDCRAIGSGDMAGNDALGVAPVPEWWPFRNQLLVTFAAARGIVLGVAEVMTGSVSSDGTHADGRPEFYDAMDRVTAVQEGGIRISAPALTMTTTELVRHSGVPREILAWAHSCHTGNLACGQCRGCVKHYQVTKEIYGVAY